MNGLFSINSPLWRFMDKALRLIWLNLLWFLCCLPIVTIGASTTALYSVTLKYARDEEGYLTRSFFQAFRQNFRQSTIIWLVMAAIGILLGLDLIVYLRASSVSLTQSALMLIFFTAVLLYLFVSLYVYAMVAHFKNTVGQYMKNALILSICHWPASILMITGGVAFFLAGMLIFPPLLFVGTAGFCYLCSKYFNRLFDRLARAQAASLPA